MISTVEAPETETTKEGSNVTFAPSAEDASAASASGKQVKYYNIPGDSVYAATQKLEDEHRNAIRWLHHHGSDNNISYADLGKQLKKSDGSVYDGNTIFKVLTGRHEAKLDNIVKSILDLKRIVEERGAITRADFIETSLTRLIYKICDTALIYQQINFIIGDYQIGKTFILEQYERTHNHGQTCYLRMPEGGGLYDVIQEFAAKLKISGQSREIKHRITRSFDDRMLLIIDEAHQSFLTNKGASRIRALEFIREIHDRCKCGVVICGSGLFDDELQNGRHRKLLQQLTRRSLIVHRLPARPTRSDLLLFSKHYGLPEPKQDALELQNIIIRDHGLGRWCSILRAASRSAHKAKQKLTWQHILDTDATLTALAGK